MDTNSCKGEIYHMKFTLGYSWEVPCVVHPYAGFMHDPNYDDNISQLWLYVMDHLHGASLTLA